MNILITGGAGFVGSNLAIHLKKAFPKYNIVVLDNLKRRGSELNISRLKVLGIVFMHGDTRNAEDLLSVGKIDILIDASAEPSVLAGIENGTRQLINNNLIGTINCLDFALENNAKFIFLSTSRVYPVKALCDLNLINNETRFTLDNLNIEGVDNEGINENFEIKGVRTFYGATKYASEILINEYNAFAQLESVINRCGVIAGPWQMGKVDQGFLTLWLSRHYYGKPLKYIGFNGTGKQVRDVLHIYDLCDLISIQIDEFSKFNGKTFNVGGGIKNAVSLKETTMLSEEVTGKTISISSSEEDRLGDIPYYVTDYSKLNEICGWAPQRNVNKILKDIYAWILENDEIIAPVLNK